MSSGNNKIISCLCGGIQLKIKGPLRHVSNCHCRQCMKTHGNYAAYTNALEKDVKFIKKRTLKWFKSSKKGKRGFCNKCGASIFYKITAKRIGNRDLHISAGMFKKPLKLKTIANIYIKSKLDYYKLDKSIPKFKREPKTYYPNLK